MIELFLRNVEVPECHVSFDFLTAHHALGTEVATIEWCAGVALYRCGGELERADRIDLGQTHIRP
ncbi:hypothetical protein [Nocardia sp. NPDC057353]|uniref:hypothetical protein n=1 Tax=Nocardia sp. NPDC057353 TaxID=3346104 RepID=UPI003631397F